MRIAFDGTTLREGQTGIGYYTEHLLHHLLREAGDGDEVVILSNRPVVTSQPLQPGAGLCRQGRFPVRNIWLQLHAPLTLGRIEADVAHFTNSVAPLLKRVPTVVTIHDMSLDLFPDFHPRRRMITRPLVHLSARRADAVITVSQSAKRDILRLTGLSGDKVHVVPEAAAPIFRRIEDASRLQSVRKRYGLADKLILFVGTLEPRKNLPRLLRAYAQLLHAGDDSHQLVCVGGFGWGYDQVRAEIERLNLEGRVILTGYVPYQDLPVLYSLSRVFVFPSLHEGFGLPVMEAMACGVPVITAAGSSLSEIAGACAELVDPRSEESITEALRRVLSDESLRDSLSRRGLENSRRFSWKHAARRTLEIYRRTAQAK